MSGIRTTKFGQVIQTSAPISPGSSGGGLFGSDGALLGFTTFALKESQNLNFAVPAVAALNLLADIESNAKDRVKAQAELRNSTTSAIAAAVGDSAPPRPGFDSIDDRMAYLRWLGRASERLKSRNSEHATRVEFLETLWYESRRAGLEPELVLGLIQVTSGFRKYAVNESGAIGYMQVAPRWATTIGDGDSARLFHVQVNLRFGCVILRHYIDSAQGDVFTALVWYFGQSQGRAASQADRDATEFVNSVFAARSQWLTGRH